MLNLSFIYLHKHFPHAGQNQSRRGWIYHASEPALLVKQRWLVFLYWKRLVLALGRIFGMIPGPLINALNAHGFFPPRDKQVL